MQSTIVVLKPVYFKYRLLLIKVIPVPEERLQNFRVYVNDMFAFTFRKETDDSWIAINQKGDPFETVNKYENGLVNQIEHTVMENFFSSMVMAEYA